MHCLGDIDGVGDLVGGVPRDRNQGFLRVCVTVLGAGGSVHAGLGGCGGGHIKTKENECGRLGGGGEREDQRPWPVQSPESAGYGASVLSELAFSSV